MASLMGTADHVVLPLLPLPEAVTARRVGRRVAACGVGGLEGQEAVPGVERAQVQPVVGVDRLVGAAAVRALEQLVPVGPEDRIVLRGGVVVPDADQAGLVRPPPSATARRAVRQGRAAGGARGARRAGLIWVGRGAPCRLAPRRWARRGSRCRRRGRLDQHAIRVGGGVTRVGDGAIAQQVRPDASAVQVVVADVTQLAVLRWGDPHHDRDVRRVAGQHLGWHVPDRVTSCPLRSDAAPRLGVVVVVLHEDYRGADALLEVRPPAVRDRPVAAAPPVELTPEASAQAAGERLACLDHGQVADRRRRRAVGDLAPQQAQPGGGGPLGGCRALRRGAGRQPLAGHARGEGSLRVAVVVAGEVGGGRARKAGTAARAAWGVPGCDLAAHPVRGRGAR